MALRDRFKTLATRRMAARGLLTTAALFIAGMAVGALKYAGLGTDPYNVLIFGVVGKFALPYAVFYGALTIAFAVVVFLLDRRYIGFTTIANFFVPGVATQLSLNLCAHLPADSLAFRGLALALALFVLCAAISMMMVCDLGLCSYDAVALIMEKRTPLSYRVCRVITDTACAAVGFALGAAVGVTTLVAMTCMGPLINWARGHISQPILDRAGGV